ncbi:MAG: hypothetical protein HY716_00605 [Planctomycetes bacterium]|nr:hypothetical protein [Planctomycetota bacterium]
MKSNWIAGWAVMGISVAAAAWPDAQEAELKKIFPDAQSVKKSALKLSKEARERIEKAIEAKLDDREASAPVWEAMATVPEANPGEKTRIRFMTLTAPGPKGTVKLGVAVAPEERVVAAVRVLENKDDPALASEEFLEQFDHFLYTSHLYHPASMLAQARERARERRDEEARQLDGIFKLESIMHPVGAAWSRLRKRLDAEDPQAAEDAAELLRLFADAERTLADLTFLKASQVRSFRTLLEKSRRDLEAVKVQAEQRKLVEARMASRDVMERCSQCHAGTHRLFRERRFALNVGNGYFAVGHDVYAPPGPRASFEAVASAIRRAVLILSELK